MIYYSESDLQYVNTNLHFNAMINSVVKEAVGRSDPPWILLQAAIVWCILGSQVSIKTEEA